MRNFRPIPLRLATAALFAAIALTATSGSASAQSVQAPAASTRVQAALDLLKTDNAWTLEQQETICEIPAPPFMEAERGVEYRKRLEALGLRNVRVDSVGNVIAERPGTGQGPTVVLAGHLDTVFPEGTDVTVKHENGRMSAPGISDDCRGLASVLAVARAMQKAGVQTTGTVYFVGDVGEEGAGNLRGMRYLFGKELAGKVDYFISIDGSGLGLTTRAVGSHRYEVTYRGPGGHSYGAFGIPNPIHAMGRAVARIADLQVPSSPKTTFSVGMVSGGTSVNSIPFSATIQIDMRSEAPASLNALDSQVQTILHEALAEENARWTGQRAARAQLTMEIDTIGIRPANSAQTASSPIVMAATSAAKALGFTARGGASSTDSNIPLSLGIPAITISGGGHGGGSHSLGEWYEDGDSAWLGPQWATLIVTRLAGAK